MKKLWKWFREKLWLPVWWWWTGGMLEIKVFQEEGSPERTEASEAVDRVVMETNIAPDCVMATVLRGGPCLIVKHDGAQEAFIHRTYALAADKAIEWLKMKGASLSTAKTTSMSRKSIKSFDAQRQKLQTQKRVRARRPK